MRSYLSFILFCSLLVVQIQAQSTFADKKKPASGQKSVPNLSNIKLPNNASKQSTVKAKTTKVANYQMPSQFSAPVKDKKYIHTRMIRAENKLPVYIKSKSISPNTKAAKEPTSETFAYLKEISPLLQIKDAGNEFSVVTKHTDQLGMTHIKMQQEYKGIKVFGAEIITHLNKRNRVEILNGRYIATPEINNIVPDIEVSKAFHEAYSDLKVNQQEVEHLNKQHMFHEHTAPNAELVIFHTKEGRDVLTWHVTVYANMIERWEYFIDANNGDIVNKFNHTCSFAPEGTTTATDLNGVSRTIHTELINGVYYMMNTDKSMYSSTQSTLPDNPVGAIVTLDLKDAYPDQDASFYYVTDSDNSWNNPGAVSAHYNADVSYDYFKNTHDRNSINGSGGTIYSIINVANEDGSGMDNAYWNGYAMFYGNGNLAFSPLAGALDVGGHELTHGVIGSTANLTYQNQSGALNESFADVFAVLIDRDDWNLGEEVVSSIYYPSGALRSMEDPHNGGTSLNDNGWQPAHMSEFYTGTQDNGGVHVNSGIPNHVFYRIASTIGREKAEQIYYRTLTTYLTASSQFSDMRIGTIQSATDLYGASSNEVSVIKSSFDAVGIYGEEDDTGDTDDGSDVPVSNGEDYILLYDVNPEDENTLYVFDVTNEEFYAVSQTVLARKPTVSDDGTLAFLVTEENKLNYLELDGANTVEYILDEDPIWGNIAISKDGTKLAAVGAQASNEIVVSDMISGNVESFELYNPTTIEGEKTFNVLYADALEWDYTGQYIMYDANNVIQNSSGEDIEYWDVGFIRVWDNSVNNFSDGNIQKLFSNLPEGISIGNPSFSKTSRNILAFDMFDATSDNYDVITANIETGEMETIWNNLKLGFPNFSRTDEQIIFDAYNTDDEEVIAVIDIAEDKISADGDPMVYIGLSKWGAWYSDGARQILNTDKDILNFKFRGTNPVSEGSIIGNNILVNAPEGTNPATLVASFTLSSNATATVNGSTQYSGITMNDFSIPVNYVIYAEDGSEKNYTVTVSVSPGTNIQSAAQNQMLISPNPFLNQITINAEPLNNNAQIEILNLLGQVVYSANAENVTNGKTTINIPETLPSGQYILQITTREIKISSKVLKL